MSWFNYTAHGWASVALISSQVVTTFDQWNSMFTQEPCRESGMLNNDSVCSGTEQEGLPEQDNHVTLDCASFRNSLTATAICN